MGFVSKRYVFRAEGCEKISEKFFNFLKKCLQFKMGVALWEVFSTLSYGAKVLERKKFF